MKLGQSSSTVAQFSVFLVFSLSSLSIKAARDAYDVHVADSRTVDKAATQRVDLYGPLTANDATFDYSTVSNGLASSKETVAMKEKEPSLSIVFSDIDGTLLHYPVDPIAIDKLTDVEPGNPILTLPPSSTGLVGIVSSKTLCYCQEIRRQGTKLVLVSGMRTATLLKRLPFLPKADAYCCEVGGRIFYTSSLEEGFKVTPVHYEGAKDEDLETFYIQEDAGWRSRMEELAAAGPYGFVGNELDMKVASEDVPLSHRQGALWDYARQLIEMGFTPDTKGYATCFRVNRKHQSPKALEVFDALINTKIARSPTVSTSTNLGAVDFYPVGSGKLNW